MNIVKKMVDLLTKKQVLSAPILLIRKEAVDSNLKEYKLMEEAIAELENLPNVPHDKIEKLRTSLKQLKDKTLITIRNGEIA